MPTKIKPALVLKIKLKERIFVHYPAKSIENAKQVRHDLTPPDGTIPYSHFQLYRDGNEIQF